MTMAAKVGSHQEASLRSPVSLRSQPADAPMNRSVMAQTRVKTRALYFPAQCNKGIECRR